MGRVLVGCEYSGIVRQSFAARGHDAWSCDLLPSEQAGNHIQGDILSMLNKSWDLAIFHPPCTYLSIAGARWWQDTARQEKIDEAAKFVFALRDAPIQRIAIENPRGQLTHRWRAPDQVINPYEFGEPFSKATCLWLKNLPPLFATVICSQYTPYLPSNTGGAKRGQRTQKGISKTKDRSRTFQGIADAMAEQWSYLI